MKKAEKMQKTADSPEQNLPGDRAVSAGNLVQDPGPVAQPAEVSKASLTDSRLVSLEKTQDLVAAHALRLSHSGHDTMRVVIEPGSGTKLSLELRYHNGTVEAQATLHRGDFEFLNQHWSELQKRLEPRGVQLGTLEWSSQSSTDQRSAHQPGGQPADEPVSRSAFAEFALDGAVSDASKRELPRTKTYPGWESWA